MTRGGVVVGPKAFGVGALLLVLLTAAAGHAQTPPPLSPSPPAPPQVPQPVAGFVSPYEVMRTARTAGFHPVAPPLREGTTYVLRATDHHGILMRVVIDARSGVIRDAAQIVPGPGRYDQYGMLPPGASPYGVPPYGHPPYAPPPYSRANLEPPAPAEEGAAPPLPPAAHAAIRAGAAPLPRPRPQNQVARKPVDPDAKTAAKTAAKPDGTANIKSDAKADTKVDSKADATTTGSNPKPNPESKPDVKSDAASTATAVTPVAPRKAAPPPDPLAD